MLDWVMRKVSDSGTCVSDSVIKVPSLIAITYKKQHLPDDVMKWLKSIENVNRQMVIRPDFSATF
jgi:hypothetical protein